MQATLIEINENGKMAYDCLIFSNPKSLSVLNSKLALKIVKVLADSPCCAIDVAKKLKQHEQKIYYHIRRLEKAGIVYTISNERRRGMIAKIYSVVSPVVATKLFEKGVEVKDRITTIRSEVTEFFSPFVKDGVLNAKIILGSTKIHGKYEARAVDSPFLTDFLLFLGSLITNLDVSSVIYRFDIDVTEEELKNNNLILIGNPKINSITDRINSSLPIYFDVNTDFRIISKLTGNKYSYDADAVVIKTKNPFNPSKELLLLAGKRSEGLRSAVIAVMNHTNEILSGNIKNKNLIAKVVSGVDKDSDGLIDGVKFYE